MKRSAILPLALCLAAFAQEKPPAAAAEPAKPEETKQETPAAEGAAAPEPMVRGSVEVGYRVLGPIGGNRDVYRSVVNLGEGVRLLNADLLMSPSLKWIDDLSIRMNNWGGDPYNSAMLRARKQNAYELNIDYRNIAYYNAMPSFANPKLETGILQNQRSFDMTRRYLDVNLDVLPGNIVVPFFGYTHDAGFGRGVTLYVPSSNEYPVPTEFDDGTDTFRGGVRFELRRFHATLETGRYDFHDDQRVYENQLNTGNRTTPFQGQNLLLRTLTQQYNIGGDAAFTRISVTANPANFLDVFGNWTWTRPDISTAYSENATGNFVLTNPTRFLPTQQLLFEALTKQPHNRAHAGFEVRPGSRIRIIQSIYVDRMFTDSMVDRLDINYQQHQIEALVDVTNRITVRGGHRYTWGDSQVRSPDLSSATDLQRGELRRNTGLAGVSYRVAPRLSASLDAEVARGERAYFRTSLRNYEKLRARVRYQAMQNLQLGWTASYLSNDNPNVFSRLQPGDYDLRTFDHSYSFVWTPAGGSKFRASGEYSRLDWRSDVLYLAPQDLTAERSLYNEQTHAGSLMFDFVPARGNNFAPRFTAGGSFVRTSGSRPARFLQPMIRAAFPLYRHVEFIGEWRYWGLRQPTYFYEDFRANQATFSLRWSQ